MNGERRVRIFKDYNIHEFNITKWIVNDFLREYDLKSCEGVDSAHFLKFRVLSLTEGYCFVSIKYKFIEGIAFNQIYKIKKYKKILLLELENRMEGKLV